MKHKIISLCVFTLMAITQGYSGVTLTVPDVNIVQGGTSSVVIYFDLGKQAYTAFQLDIAYPEGISSVNDDNDCPAFLEGDVYNKEHNVSSIYTVKGLNRFQCFSINSVPFTAQSGTLLILPIKAQKSMAEGTYQATISPIEFVQTDATPDRPAPITFNITVTKCVVLDELSTMAPTAATDVNVQVKRTIKANEWSTICLPFAMSEAQMKAAFGNDVQLGDFVGYEKKEDGENIVGITVKFKTVKAIEANRPYVIKVSEAISEFLVDGVTVTPVDEPCIEYDNGKTGHQRVVLSRFVGTYVAGVKLADLVAGGYYPIFLNGGKFWYASESTKTMKAFRAYFDFYDVLASVEENSVKMFIDVESESTQIDELIPETSNETIYDLSGRRVSKVERGIYIVNGKKILK